MIKVLIYDHSLLFLNPWNLCQVLMTINSIFLIFFLSLVSSCGTFILKYWPLIWKRVPKKGLSETRLNISHKRLLRWCRPTIHISKNTNSWWWKSWNSVPWKGLQEIRYNFSWGMHPVQLSLGKLHQCGSNRKCNNDRNLGNMSFEERLMDTLYHLLKIKPQREVHDCRCSCLIFLGFGTNLCSGFSAGKMPVYLLECSVLRQYSSTEKMIPKSPFFAEKKYRRYRLLSLGFANTLLLKGETITAYPEVVDVFHWKILTKSLVNLYNGLCT